MTRRHPTSLFLVMAALVVGGCSANLGGCNSNSGTANGGQQGGNDLDSMSTAKLSIGETEFQTWIANTDEEREKGLMFVEAEQMQPMEDGKTFCAMALVPDPAQRLANERVLDLFVDKLLA